MRLAGLLLAGTLTLAAGTIDVTRLPSGAIHPGAYLVIDIGVWPYGVNNRGYSPYPTALQLAVTGLAPVGETAASLPGTTAEYFGSLLFTGWVESLDGSVSAPLVDPGAALVGEPSALLVRPGIVTTGGADPWDAAVIMASLSIPPEIAEALFAGNVGSSVGARVRLRNIGGWFTVGGEPGHTVRDAISVTGISGQGPVQTGGITGTVLLQNPEPSTIALFAIGLGAMFLLARRMGRLRTAKVATRRKSVG